jgi:hypothetical protein
MREPEIIEAELMEISALADDLVKFERIVAWCAAHPDEAPFALHHLMRRNQSARRESREPEPKPDESSHPGI